MHLSVRCHIQLCAVSCLFNFSCNWQVGRRKRLATEASSVLFTWGRAGGAITPLRIGPAKVTQLNTRCWREPMFIPDLFNSFYGPTQMAPCTVQMLSNEGISSSWNTGRRFDACGAWAPSITAFDSPVLRAPAICYTVLVWPMMPLFVFTKTVNEALCSFYLGMCCRSR